MEIIGLSARFCMSFVSPSYGETVLYCSNKRQSRLQHSTLRNAQPFNTQNSKSALPIIQNSKLKISFANNSKFKTQNSKSALPIIQNSKLKIQNSTSHPSILFISILFASLTLEMSTESRYTSVVFMDLCPMPTLMTETGTFTFRATLAHVWRAT